MKLTEDDRYALERIYLANMQKDKKADAIALHCIRAGMERAAKICDAIADDPTPEHNFDAKLCAAAIRKAAE